jgi:hypothetical protein
VVQLGRNDGAPRLVYRSTSSSQVLPLIVDYGTHVVEHTGAVFEANIILPGPSRMKLWDRRPRSVSAITGGAQMGRNCDLSRSGLPDRLMYAERALWRGQQPGSEAPSLFTLSPQTRIELPRFPGNIKTSPVGPVWREG